MSLNLKSPLEGLKNAKCKKSMLPVRPPIPYVPPTDHLKKQETEQIKVELPDGTKFQMPTYGSGNNKDKEYLVHIIAIQHLVKQKGTVAKVKEAFAALAAARKEMSPFFNFPEDKTVATKEGRKKKLNEPNKSLKAKITFAVKQAQKLMSCSVALLLAGANAMGQNCKQNAHKEPLNWREWQIQLGDLRKNLGFIHGLH
jgi:hypothetical protein